MRRAHLLLLSLVVGSPLAGQAPVVGPNGDPSVDADTIYALAVKPADHPEESSVLLLDDGIVVQQSDGTGSVTYRQIAQILNRDGVDTWAEETFRYDGGRQHFRLNWAKVVRPDGTVVSAEPIHQSVSDVPVPEESPVYTDMKRVRVSLGGVEPGTIVDYSYTIETFKPVMPRDFFASWSINTGGTVRRSRYIVDVPEGYRLRSEEHHLRVVPRVTHANGRVVREWSTHDLKYIEPEMFAETDSADFLQGFSNSGPDTWADIGHWYAGLAKGRYAVDDSVMQAARDATAGAKTPEEKIEALYRWIAQDIRYISISLGDGGYQPRMPAEVVRTRSGDCKDKATLFVALARKMGFEAYPVLLNSGGEVEKDVPSVRQFDHEIAALRRNGKWTFLDLTGEVVPFGQIPPSYQGGFGLVVFDDGSVEQVTFPETTAAENVRNSTLTGEMHEDGSLTGWYTEEDLGNLQYRLRSALAQEFSNKDLERLRDALAGSVINGATGDSLSIFDGRDLKAVPRVKVRVDAERAARRNDSSTYVFPIPLGSMGNPSLVTRLEKERGTRRYPIDVGAVVGPVTLNSDVAVTLPIGWKAELPPAVHAASDFGTYDSEYSQNGRELHIVRHISGRDGVEPKEKLPELIDWLKKLADDDVKVIVLRTGAGS
jgi:transglutaminase-like putative cysteine protease